MLLITVFSLALVAFGNSNPAVPTYDTIIIGMGAAGCSAASVLSKAGKKVLALEAQNRVGGRVHTVHLGSGVVELGAEWIHGVVHSPVYELAVANNITIIPQGMEIDLYRSDGSKNYTDLGKELLAFALEKYEEPSKNAKSIGQYLTREIKEYARINHPELVNDQDFIDEILYFMDPVINSYEASDSWNDVTTQSNFVNLEGSLEMSWHKYGYNTLFEILLNSYNNGNGLPNLDLKLNKPVTEISYSTDPEEDVVVTCVDSSTYRAKNVIVTVSLGVLKATHNSLFSPPLPKIKVESIDNISFGAVGKILLEFDQVWWKPDVAFNAFIWKGEDKKQVPPEDKWTTKVIGPALIMGSNTTISLWTTGEETRLTETLSEDVLRRKSMELIRRFMGKDISIPEPKTMLRSTWYTNPYTRGTYSFENLETPLHPLLRSNLAEPLTDTSGAPRVLFAGEATNPIHFSTVHGAVETGYREAHRLLPKAAE